MVVLAATTGATDAMSFLGLGGVFTSVMTANLVLLGVSAGQRSGALAVHVGTAVAGFVVATLITSRLTAAAAEPQALWPRRVTAALTAEAVLLVAVTVGWEIAGGRPRGAAQLLLLAGAAGVMGIQGAAIRALGVPGLSTTYLTGLLTAVLSDLATARDSANRGRGVVILIALILGAAGSSVLTAQAPRLVPLLPLALLAAVVAAATAGRSRQAGPGQSAGGRRVRS